MKYVETSRSIEPHSECLINIYVRDEQGAPVPNVKFKIWAGPPPDGMPPYFQDDDPENPNRRTDANGRFQFVVANPAPANAVDYFVQLEEAGTTTAPPVHLTFQAGVAQWISVTLAPEGAVAPSGEVPALPELDLDPRLSQLVGVEVEFVQPTANLPYWKLISARYLDPEESGGNVNIVCYVQDEYGKPLPGARVIQRWPGDEASSLTDELGHIEFPMSGDSSFDPAREEHGPYSALISGMAGDAVVGMGLPLKRHVEYVLTWRKAVVSPLVTQPAPGPAAGHARIEPAAPQTGRPASQSAKPFDHYLLFGPGNVPSTMTNLILALDYIVRFAPLVGFKASDAKNATHVTIVGDTNGVSQADEQSLRDAGCQVVRLTAADSYALETIFKELVSSGSPYPR